MMLTSSCKVLNPPKLGKNLGEKYCKVNESTGLDQAGYPIG